MSVLSDYNVKLYNNTQFEKQIFSINTWLSAYIYSHSTLNKANQLLNLINDTLIAPPNSVSEMPTQGMYIAIISPTETKIYHDIDNWMDNLTADFTLPTAHFKVIVEAWRNYLQ
jgi:hypothetical protein